MASDEVPIPDPTISIGATFGVDMEAEEVAALLPLAERPFDAATYQPHTHVPSLGGILRFKGFIPRLDEDTLFMEDRRLPLYIRPPTLVRTASRRGPHFSRCCWLWALLLRAHTDEG
ncbi:hypothetical protein CsSME_00041268 [Camellia sinensis var. sinensis]